MESGIRILEEGKVHIEYGPVSMVVMAYENGKALTDLCTASFTKVRETLEELQMSMDYLKRYSHLLDERQFKGIGKNMVQAVQGVGEPLLTPMAAVAGSVSDEIANWLFSQGATKAIVNNGGDIALRLDSEEEIRLGVISDICAGVVSEVVTITGLDRIGGIATSGFGGRSHTRGVASAVTAFGGTCAIADAWATHIANGSFVQSDNVTTRYAGEIDPLTDIPELEVVTHMGTLSSSEVEESIKQMKRIAKSAIDRGQLLKVTGCVQETSFIYPES